VGRHLERGFTSGGASPPENAAPGSAGLRLYFAVSDVTWDGLPLIGAISGVPGAYVTIGHSVWGIVNAPATGEAVAELTLDRATRPVDLSPFDPARLAAIEPRHVTVTPRCLSIANGHCRQT
jgi:hypothetical protein